jgi:hypothetical protein
MAANHPTRKCGALAPSAAHLAAAPKFEDFLTAPLDLSSTPAENDNVTGAAISMAGNDEAGDCTCAGGANLLAIWCHALGIAITIVTAKILAFYYALTGGPDTGLMPTTVLAKMATDGIDVGDGVVRKVIWAIIPTDNLPLMRFLIWKLKAVYLCGSLSDNDVSAASWTLPENPGPKDQPDPENGHCFLAAGFGPLSADGKDCPMAFPTWGFSMPGWFSWFAGNARSRGTFAAAVIDEEAAAQINFDFEGAAAVLRAAAQMA